MDEDDASTIEADPLDGGWEDEPEELPHRPRRRLLTPATGMLLAVLLVAGGFIAGVLVEKGQTGSGGGGGLPAAFAAARAGGRGGGGAGGGAGRGFGSGQLAGAPAGAGGGAQQPTVGQVSTVDGDTLYVTDAQGNTVKVTAAKGATVTRQVDSRVRAIHPGETVIVQGASSRGAIVATSIRASPGLSGGTGGGGGVVSQLFGSGSGGGAAANTTREAP
jgi:hypothetical protein